MTEVPQLEFRILGPLEVEGGSGPIALGGQKQRALLAVLLLDAGRVVATDRLVDLVWGEEAPKTATTSLQNSISRLRRELGADVLETRAPGYVLRAAPEQIDSRRFEVLLGDARRAGAKERRTLLEQALSLWRGSALAEFAFDDFAQAETRRLEELRLVAHEERIEADLELGRHGDVAGELEALVREHPLRETLRAPAHVGALPLGTAGGSTRRVSGRAHTLRRGARDRARPGPQAAPDGDLAARGRNRGTGRDVRRRRRRRDHRRAPRGARRAGAGPRRRERSCSPSRTSLLGPGPPPGRSRARFSVRRDDERLRARSTTSCTGCSRRPSSPRRSTGSLPSFPSFFASAALHTSSS